MVRLVSGDKEKHPVGYLKEQPVCAGLAGGLVFNARRDLAFIPSAVAGLVFACGCGLVVG